MSRDLHETSFKWYPEKKANLCAHCGGKCVVWYMATGHDHTDYEYWLCDCKAAKETGKPASMCK
jgi:hypothetical protein